MSDDIKPVITDPVEEVLVILAEECAEVIKEVTKIQRFGLHHTGPGKNIMAHKALASECGQLLAMIGILKRAGIVTNAELAPAIATKLLKLVDWSNLPVEWLKP